MKGKEPLYSTQELIHLFQTLADDGYEGMNMKLITDMIELGCKDITEGEEITWLQATEVL
jgi:Ca2+-binding EF-hand superfamily protein